MVRAFAYALMCLCSFLTVSCSGYTSSIHPKLTVSSEYTDNARLSGSNSEGDVLTLISPSVSYDLRGRHKDLNLTYSPALAYYAMREEDLTIRHFANLSSSWQMSKHLKTESVDSFTRTDEPYLLPEPVFIRTDQPIPTVDAVDIRTNRRPYNTFSGNKRLSYQFGPSDFLDFDYTYGLLDNEDPAIEDSMHHTPLLGLRYWFTPKWGLETKFSYTRGDFSQDSSPFNQWFESLRVVRKVTNHLSGFAQYANTFMDFETTGGELADVGSYQIHDASLGLDYTISEMTFLTFSTGYFIRDSEKEGKGSGYSVNADLARRFQRGAVRLSGGTGYQQTFFGTENLGFTEYYRVSLIGTYELMRRLTGSLTTSYQTNSYTDIASREDTILTSSAGLTYSLRSWISMALTFTHRTVDSTLNENDFDENRVMISFTFTPQRPFRMEH